MVFNSAIVYPPLCVFRIVIANCDTVALFVRDVQQKYETPTKLDRVVVSDET